MKKNEYNKWYLIIAIFAVIFTFFGGSLAYWQWTTNETERTSIALTVKEDFRCDADGGGDISNNEKYLVPTDCTNTDYAIQRTVTVKPTLFSNELGVDLDLWLNIDNIGTGLKNSNNFKYALTKSSTSCTSNVVASGTFKSKSNGSKVTLLDKGYNGTVTETYYLYIWLDKAETSTATMDQEFSLSLGGECISTTEIEPEAPVLDEGMIPVKLSNTGVATTVSSTDDTWYNYANKEWANAVLVNENASGITGSYSREYYLNNPGTTVSETDILAYYVWIPRYKYQIWTTSNSSNGKEQTINIIFETKNTTKSNGTTVGEYKTHPAFTLGNEELAGIWVGKFETTGNATTPTVLPNKQSLRSQNVSTQFTTSIKFSGGTMNTSTGAVTFAGSNTYGLTNQTDSHMMKNSEWGALAYLSHSKYGINEEIYINNSSSYYTGRSAGEVGNENNETPSYGTYSWTGQTMNSDGSYGAISDSTLGTKASTTGNITGLYDMSGGAWEYVMGVLSDSNGNPRSGYSSVLNSGFNGTIYDEGNNTLYTGGISFPNSKYYDLYLQSQFNGSDSTNMKLCTLETCGGHALNETASWYNDYALFVLPESPWFVRGGRFGDDLYAGAFYSSHNDGYGSSRGSWRSVLVAGNGA